MQASPAGSSAVGDLVGLQQQWFDALDSDQDGRLEAIDVRNMLIRAGYNVDEKYVNELMRLFDRNRSRKIEFAEFRLLWGHLSLGNRLGITLPSPAVQIDAGLASDAQHETAGQQPAPQCSQLWHTPHYAMHVAQYTGHITGPSGHTVHQQPASYVLPEVLVPTQASATKSADQSLDFQRVIELRKLRAREEQRIARLEEAHHASVQAAGTHNAWLQQVRNQATSGNIWQQVGLNRDVGPVAVESNRLSGHKNGPDATVARLQTVAPVVDSKKTPSGSEFWKSTSPKEAIQILSHVTGTSIEQSKHLLTAAKEDIRQAINLYFDEITAPQRSYAAESGKSKKGKAEVLVNRRTTAASSQLSAQSDRQSLMNRRQINSSEHLPVVEKHQEGRKQPMVNSGNVGLSLTFNQQSVPAQHQSDPRIIATEACHESLESDDESFIKFQATFQAAYDKQLQQIQRIEAQQEEMLHISSHTRRPKGRKLPPLPKVTKQNTQNQIDLVNKKRLEIDVANAEGEDSCVHSAHTTDSTICAGGDPAFQMSGQRSSDHKLSKQTADEDFNQQR